MGYDTVASLQRIEQLKQAQAATGKRLVLKRVNTKLDITLTVIAILLFLPTLTATIWLLLIYLGIKEFSSKTYLVQNIATGEKFRVKKEEWKEYKKAFKKKENEVRSIR